MAEECRVCLLGLIFLCPLLTGTNGVGDSHMFFRSGENVRLPCNNARSNCTSTTWAYNKHSTSVELITSGKMKKDTERHERLSLGSDCSLNIKNITGEDYGFYTCRQYMKGQKQGDDASIYLHVLHVSSSSSQTEIRPGRSVTLSCQLYYHHGVLCDYLILSEGVQLMWVNQSGVNLKTDSRYQILSSSSLCNISLTTTLLNEDHNREWRCQLTQRNELKKSVTYTVKYSVNINYEDSSTPETPTQVIVISAVFAAFVVVIVAVLICKKRADNKRAAESVVVKDLNDHEGTYDTINHSISSVPNINTDDVTYIEVISSGKKPVKMENDNSYNRVTYAVVRGTENTLQDGLYATVDKKTSHK